MRSAMWWLAAIAYGVANIVFHEPVNQIFEWLAQVMGISLFLWSMRISAVVGAALVVAFRWNFLKEPGTLRRVLIFIALGMALDLSLVIYPSERIHYPQYAILTWIAYKATGAPVPAALFAFVVGYVDEGYQHWVLYAKQSIAYFDWNDIVLNLLGVLSALVLLPQEAIRKPRYGKLVGSAISWTLLMSILVFLLNPDPVLMRAHKDTSFWLTSNVKTHYHVLNTLEGTILLGVMWIITIGVAVPLPLGEADAQGASGEGIDSEPPTETLSVS
jgi:hypothetical protein